MATDKKKKIIANIIAALLTAVFVFACLLVTRCHTTQPTTVSIMNDRPHTGMETDTCKKEVKTTKKKKSKKEKARPAERSFLDENIPDSL